MIVSPVIIVGCPRSGTTLLYNILSEVPSLWSIGYESKEIIERLHHPRAKNWESGALDETDLTPASRAYILDAFERNAAPGTFWRRINRFRGWLQGNPAWTWIKRRGRTEKRGSAVSSAVPQQGLDMIRAFVRSGNSLRIGRGGRSIRLLEKTPENCLRLPFLLAVFPDARVIYLTREGPANVNSLIEGWKQPHLFPGYRVPEPLAIPGYERDRWAFTLIPGWRDLVDRPLEQVCAWQWIRCNEAVLGHRERTRGEVPYLTVRYEDLVADPVAVLRRIVGFIGVDFEHSLGRFRSGLPRVNVVSKPDLDKWKRRNPEAIQRILPLIQPMGEKLGYPSSSW
jgi:hypothetical protein